MAPAPLTQLVSGSTPVLTNSSDDWFQISLPLQGLPAFKLTAAHFSLITIEDTDDGSSIRYRNPVRDGQAFDIEACVLLKNLDNGSIRASMTLENHEAIVIPQIQFPCLRGVGQGLDVNETRFVMGRNSFALFEALALPDDCPDFYDLGLTKYLGYPFSFEFSMKWFDITDGTGGISVYSEDATANIQGVNIERPSRTANHVNVDWCHFPYSGPNTSWDSPSFVIDAHTQGWTEGIKKYRDFAQKQFEVLPANERFTSGVGYLSVWMREPFSDSIHKSAKEIPILAREAKSCGLNEIVLWFAVDGFFGFPPGMSEALGSPQEWRQAISDARSEGVNVSIFVSCNLVTKEASDSSWYVLNQIGEHHGDNWTYDWGFTPRFRPSIDVSGYGIYSCPGSPEWQNGYANLVEALSELGASISYDQLFVKDLCFNPTHDHSPNEAPNILYDLVGTLQNKTRAVDANATFSAEFLTDVSSSFQDYTWEWTTYEPHPFKYVFPRNYSNLLVDRESPRALQAILDGMLLNVFPDHGRGRVSSGSDLGIFLGRLSGLKKQWLRFFDHGEYRHNEGLDQSAADIGRVWVYGNEAVVFLHRHGAGEPRVITLDLSHLLQESTGSHVAVIYDIDGMQVPRATPTDLPTVVELVLQPNEFRAIHVTLNASVLEPENPIES